MLMNCLHVCDVGLVCRDGNCELFVGMRFCNRCGCHPVTFLNWNPLFGWCVVRSGSKSKHHKVTCLKENGMYKLYKLLHT